MEAKMAKAPAKKPVVTTVAQYFGLKTPAQAHDATYELDKSMSSRLVGIEVEVENHELQRHPSPIWVVKDDGSLRNNGAEWVTRPISAMLARAALTDLLTNSLDNACCFSPRTSVHVHVNCCDLDVNKVPYLATLYVLFEKLLYRFAGRGRMKNIFCVPVQETEELDSAFSIGVNTLVAEWSKYTGFNLHPLAELGTVEARHMHGTRDVDKLAVWVDLLTRLVDYVHHNPFDRLKFEIQRVLDGAITEDYLVTVFGLNWIHLGFTGPRDLESGIEAARKAFLAPVKIHDQIRKDVTRESAYFTARITKGL